LTTAVAVDGLDRLRATSACAEAFLDALARRGEPLGHHAAALLRLLDLNGAAAFDGALQEALARGAVSAPSVAHLLDQRARARRQPPPLSVVLPDKNPAAGLAPVDNHAER
jgi:hypothetical protein